MAPTAPATPLRVTVPSLVARKESGEKITALTAYDFTMARLLDRAGIDMLLVGDSVACVVQGYENTLPVTLDEMVYHCRCVVRGVRRALVVGDLPFMSYQGSLERGIESAGRLMKEGGVAAVKLEGGVSVAPLVAALSGWDIPVVGHVGLTPQSYHRMGGHKLQGKRSSASREAGTRERILDDARAVAEAGAFAVVIEGVPADLAREITEEISALTIGIGAGPHCDGQILVSSDMLGLGGEGYPSFVKCYAQLSEEVQRATTQYISEVRSGHFPATRNAQRPLKVAKG